MAEEEKGKATGTASGWEMVRSLVSGTQTATLLLDSELRLVHFNDAFTKLSGVMRSELEKLTGALVDLDGLGHQFATDLQSIREVLSSGRPLHKAPPESSLQTEAVTRLERSLIPLSGSGGQTIGVAIHYRDVGVDASSPLAASLSDPNKRAEALERRIMERTQQLTRAVEEVTRLARTDPLTGALNRRAFVDFANQALKLAGRHGRNAGIMICDLDHFKALNDDHGHGAGDAILKAIPAAIAGVIRECDLVARIGGEEFAILLAETSTLGVGFVAERCTNAVRAIDVKALVPNKRTPQTASMGAAVFPTHGETLDDLFASADQALYAAKNNGRDQSVVYFSGIRPRGRGNDLVSKPRATRDRPRALLVLPNSETAASYTRILESELDVVVAGAGVAALSLTAKQRFDIIVADEYVATESGVDLLYKSIAYCPRALRVLLVSHRDAFLGLASLNRASLDHCLLHAEAATHLLDALVNGLSRKALLRRQERIAEESAPLAGNRVEALQRVIQQERLHFVFQPIFRAEDGSLFGYEALCRAKEEAVAEPEVLFETAVRSGLLWPLGRLVRRTISTAFERMSERPCLFINLHPSELGDHRLLEGEPFLMPQSHRIVFEITERASLQTISRLRENVKALRRHGFRIAVDDLGAGYAGLNSVALLSPDFIKIDMALTRDIDRLPTKRALVRSMVSFARDAGILVVAEGIETAEECEAVKALGCQLLQGYFLGRPAVLEP